MFEAFRCARPLAGAPAARPAQAMASAASPEPLQRATKRRKGLDGDRASAAAAAGEGGSKAERGGGLALEKMGDRPLRLVIVGHNPSDHAWASGHFYSNPSNRMWPILRETGLAPPDAIRGAQDDGLMPEVAGVGFTDVGSGSPGTDSSQFSSQHFQAWRPAFFARIAAQAARAALSIGCTCGRCGAPLVVAFSGKRQFQELFPSGGGGGSGKRSPGCVPAARSAAAGGQGKQSATGAAPVPTLQAQRPGRVEVGRQWVLPEGWPLPLSTEVWVMTSTSGAAPMTNAQRTAPWRALAQRLELEAWPQLRVPLCTPHAPAGEGAAAAQAGAAAADG